MDFLFQFQLRINQSIPEFKDAAAMEYARFLSGCFSGRKTNAIVPPPPKALDELVNFQQQQEEEEVDLDREQHVIVMRHGDRIDHAQPGWILEAKKRAWDPPLLQKGKDRAFSTGICLKNNLPSPIHRVIVSPFLRCVQTASQVVSAFLLKPDHDHDDHSNVNANSYPSIVKVTSTVPLLLLFILILRL